VYTIGTQTQEKKNRKKRACLGLNEANAIKKFKANDDTKEAYYKFILNKCVKPPKKGEKRLPLLPLVSIYLILICVFFISALQTYLFSILN
jgi:hypothetical protein